MLHALERGAGAKRLLILHGFLGSARNLFGFSGRLCEADPELQVRLPDLLGHGASPSLPSEPTLEVMAEATVEWLDQVGWHEPVDIMGHSLGGRVALAMARQHAARIRRLILLDIAPGPVDTRSLELAPILELVRAAAASVPSRDEMRDWFMAQGVAPPLAEWLIMNLLRQPDGQFTWRFDRERLALLNDSSSQADLWHCAEGIAQRLTSIRGEQSSFVGEADVRRFASLRVPVHTIAGAGHFVHVDAPDRLQQTLTQILKG